MKRGGSRKGKPNKVKKEERDLLKDAIDLVAKGNGGYQALIQSMWESAQGVTVKETNKATGEEKVYTKAPDTFAAKTLLEFRFGKPAQTLVGDPKNPLTVKIIQDVAE